MSGGGGKSYGGLPIGSNCSLAAHADECFHIGNAALKVKNDSKYVQSQLFEKGQVKDWDHMERFWLRCFYDHLRCSPEEHVVCLTEPPLSSIDSRETVTEIMFETFGVQGLQLANPASMALFGNHVLTESSFPPLDELTGLVVDIGESVTSIIPVTAGYVVGSCVKQFGLGGSNVTRFILDSLTARHQPVPDSKRWEVAEQIKQSLCYVSANPRSDVESFRADKKRHKQFRAVGHDAKETCISVAEERFMGPEVLFNPSLLQSQSGLKDSGHQMPPLAEMMDTTIQLCPIDYRRPLYENIVLSGGS